LIKQRGNSPDLKAVCLCEREKPSEVEDALKEIKGSLETSLLGTPRLVCPDMAKRKTMIRCTGDIILNSPVISCSPPIYCPLLSAQASAIIGRGPPYYASGQDEEIKAQQFLFRLHKQPRCRPFWIYPYVSSDANTLPLFHAPRSLLSHPSSLFQQGGQIKVAKLSSEDVQPDHVPHFGTPFKSP